MKASEIRSRFLAFFAARGHTIVPSSSLVPTDDPTLLFTNAGMNQFKSVLMGLETRDYVRAASVQKCMRVSGKHNDLEEVGKDVRHHTFFEMLGNWSFGDYTKRDSIVWGWEFLTDEMALAADRLWVSVYKDDDESYAIWRDEIGVPAPRIVRLGNIERGDEENFWSMADTGPCGPCTEIHFDQGAAMQCDHPAGCAVGVCDCDRWLELWNHVFMEFDRDKDGALSPLPLKSVDTGLGFERLVAVMQKVTSNYETDLFTPLIAKVAELSGREPVGADRVSMQVIADHARAVTFTVADGARPSSEKRGYVVRRILRRAARHGHLLGLDQPFLWQVADLVIAQMGDAYPELPAERETVLAVIRKEEERFLRTLAAGLEIYTRFKEQMRREGRTTVSGEEAFKLHDTYGFPVDLTAVIAGDDGLTVDEDGFTRCMNAQRERSRTQTQYMAGIGAWQPVEPSRSLAGYRNRFVGYDVLQAVSKPVAVRAGGETADGAALTHVLCAETPFYAEAGGQVGDTGMVTLLPSGEQLPVVATVAAAAGSVCVVRAATDALLVQLGEAERIELVVDPVWRLSVMQHHTATHLLHAALREVLGDDVEQRGSVVAPDRLRFDFSHDGPVAPADLERVEELVNSHVLANRAVIRHDEVPLAEARRRGAMALFGEKYGDRVRMIEIHGDAQADPVASADAGPLVSLELCGGTHCRLTGDVGPVRIVSETGVAAGVRRIEAVAGEQALALAAGDRRAVAALGDLLRRDGRPLADQVAQLVAERDALRDELAGVQHASARDALEAAIANPQSVAGIALVAARVTADDRDALMKLGDHVRDQIGSGVVVLAAQWEDKATLIATVTPDLVEGGRLCAGDLVKAIAASVGGRGGGRPHMAQAGLPDPSQIDPALAAAPEVIEKLIG